MLTDFSARSTEPDSTIADSTKENEAEESSDYSSSDGSVDSDLDYERIADIRAGQRFENDKRVAYDDYIYVAKRDKNFMQTDVLMKETAMRKLQFIFKEVIFDMGISKGTMWDYAETLLIVVFVFWLRMIIHYLGQYVFLKLINAPVIELDYKLTTFYKLTLDYAYWSQFQQIGTILMGYMSNTLLFVLLILTCHLSQKYIFCFPVKLCKVIAWYGLATMLDFFIFDVLDFADQNNNGDLFRLYNYYQETEGAGAVGLFLTLLIQMAMLILNFFIFYNYIAFVHCDARLSDIYLRISGIGRGYHCPLDNEVSWAYLK